MQPVLVVRHADVEQAGLIGDVLRQRGVATKVVSPMCAAPPRFAALHWHGDVFDLPAGARHLASSDRTAHQAFAHGRAWGLLFHLEAPAEQVSAMARAFPEELSEAGTSSAALMSATRRFAADAARVGSAVFDRWVDLLSS